jgi:CRISPR-associated protein Cmr2
MTRYLMAFSIGPVQEFISAARRTRDLWMGSTIMSEVAKAVAKWVVEQPPVEDAEAALRRLIFPAPTRSSDLDPWAFSVVGDAPLTDFNVANVILALVETENPEDFATGARRSAERKWNDFLDFIEQLEQDRDRPGEPGPFADVDKSLWRRQRTREFDVIDFYAAWAECSNEYDMYSAARRRVMQLLNGRKACRDFQPWAGEAGRPKSSLDAARESVLVDRSKVRSKLRLAKHEQLDIVGMVKRVEFGNDSIRYPSVSRFAADPWIRGVRARPDKAPRLEQMAGVSDQLLRIGALRNRRQFPGKPEETDTDKYPWLADTAFEGTPLYVDRHTELEGEAPPGKADEARRQLATIKAHVGALAKLHRDPSPYFAIIAADGDRMGATISTLAELNDPVAHRAFSLAQTRFADEIRRKINGTLLRGATVYAGGDDVLAFLPLDKTLECARTMRDLFRDTLWEELRRTSERALAHLEAAGGLPRLSVGIAIGHFMEPLEDLLQYARAAELRAKNLLADEEARGQAKRNGIAIAIHARGGAPFTVRDNWGRGIVERIERWAELYRRKQLPAKAAYDLRQIAQQYLHPWTDADVLSRAVQQDALRVLARKRGEGDDRSAKEEIRHLLVGETTRPGIRNSNDLLALAHELLVGQWIAGAQTLAEGGVTVWHESEAGVR